MEFESITFCGQFRSKNKKTYLNRQLPDIFLDLIEDTNLQVQKGQIVEIH
jgi:hypothetical protein